ncbi:hypothetical protein H7X87_03945 [Acetobacteraceae bacterium]|nr:hypothetical protein [Candidatus Parcubacteria bacterium]
MQHFKEHSFANGDILSLATADTYVGLHGLTIYSVSYGEGDIGDFQTIGIEHFMSKEEAEAAFDKRISSDNPRKPTREHAGTYGIVIDAFARYVDGPPIFGRTCIPSDWTNFFDHVKGMTIGHNNPYYNGAEVHKALMGLDPGHDGGANAMVELPAWKLLEMLTAITALAMIVRLQSEPRIRVAA